MTFTSLLHDVGKGFEKGLKWALVYAIPAEKLVAILFPSTAPAAAGIIDATSLVQSAVLVVEQKYAAANAQHGTGPEKLAEVLQLIGPVVTQLLKQAGITADSAYIQSLISAVVAILNVHQMPATSTATA
jgi:hypothetical protein